MQWVSTVSTAPRFEDALDEVTSAAEASLAGTAPDLVVVFVSPHHRPDFLRLPSTLRERLSGGVILGCSAGGVIGGGREIEQAAGLSLTAAALPGVEVTPFHLLPDALPAADALPSAWHECVGVDPDDDPSFLLLPDPFTIDVEHFISGIDRAYPGATKIGGLASGGNAPGQNVLYCGDDIDKMGVCGVALCGNIQIDTIVAQGCRPIGQPAFVTRSEGNVIRELDGRNAADVLQDLYNTLPERDRQLFRNSLFVGLVMSESQEVYDHGDFLIRNVIGLDSRTGALAVGAPIRDRAVVQFHLRDATTSADDLEAMLEDYGDDTPARPPAGGLLFSCLGRGKLLYGAADHDSNALRARLGPIPLGGFFCNGEIGPIQGTTYLHGYTSSFGLVRPRHSN